MTSAIQQTFKQAVTLHQQGKLTDAARLYEQVLQQAPKHFDALHLLGLIAGQEERPERAIRLIEKAIKLNPDVPAMHINLGTARAGVGKFDQALASYDRAIALKPEDANAHYGRANALRDLNRLEDAVLSYAKALTLKSDASEIYGNYAKACQQLGWLDKALDGYRKVVSLNANDPMAYYNLGGIFLALKRFEEAISNYDRAISLKANYVDAFGNRALALRALGRYEEALESVRRAISLSPERAGEYSRQGIILFDLKRFDEALTSYSRAIELNPDYANARWNQSLAFLTMGRFKEGWEQFEWRKKKSEPLAIKSFPQPDWTGSESVLGKTVFLHWEQGLGDTIQFCRYAKMVHECGAKVVMSVQDPLVRLAKQFEPEIEIIGENETPNFFDYQTPLMSLPLAFGTTLETIPYSLGYLKAEPGLKGQWARRLLPKTKPRIGLVWSAARDPDTNYNRSIPLEQLRPLLTTKLDWICLQKEIIESDRLILDRLPMIRVFGGDLLDFADTAALADELDLIVSVDTSVAHLAGALGKPVWILLPSRTDWRWLQERTDSPWYSSARLFRQRVDGDWATVIDDLKHQIKAFFELSDSPYSDGAVVIANQVP